MLREALNDKSWGGGNTHFALLSESCIPLFPLATIVSALGASRVTSIANAFPNGDPKTNGWGGGFAGMYARHPASEHGVAITHFDVTSQWFTAEREFAIIIAYESGYWDDMQVYCEIGRTCAKDYKTEMDRHHEYLEREWAKLKQWSPRAPNDTSHDTKTPPDSEVRARLVQCASRGSPPLQNKTD